MKIRLQSFTKPGQHYDVDKDTATCTCPAFAAEKHCKHLEAVGCYKLNRTTLSARPSFSQALSALVKSIRLRDINEGAYWLHYCWGFRDKLSGSQFRVVRRLLIGSAEDGHSIAVMEKLAENFPALLSKQVEFKNVMAELLRICKVPNWWNPATGGHDYIHSGMLASRKILYDEHTHGMNRCLTGIDQAINEQDKVGALFWLMKAQREEKGAGLQIAQHLLKFSAHRHHTSAHRLMENVYLKHAKSLTDDENFIGQAAWLLAGGVSPVVDQIEIVTHGEVRRLIEQVNDTKPYPPPEWGCDGIHCAGNDIRYAGMWDRMYAVCNQFKHYQRVHPDDVWLEDAFYSLDGLTVGKLD